MNDHNDICCNGCGYNFEDCHCNRINEDGYECERGHIPTYSELFNGSCIECSRELIKGFAKIASDYKLNGDNYEHL